MNLLATRCAPQHLMAAALSALLLIATTSKLAAFGMAMRLLVEGLLGLANDWQQMIIVLACRRKFLAPVG